MRQLFGQLGRPSATLTAHYGRTRRPHLRRQIGRLPGGLQYANLYLHRRPAFCRPDSWSPRTPSRRRLADPLHSVRECVSLRGFAAGHTGRTDSFGGAGVPIDSVPPCPHSKTTFRMGIPHSHWLTAPIGGKDETIRSTHSWTSNGRRLRRVHQPSSPTPDPRRRSLKTPLPGRKWAAALGGHVFTCQGGTGSLICCWLLALPLLSSFSGLFLFLPAPLSLAPLCPTGPQALKQSQQRPRAERRTLTRLSDCAGVEKYTYR